MYAHILRAVWVNASRREVRTVWIELCEVSYSMRWDWILKASALLVNMGYYYLGGEKREIAYGGPCVRSFGRDSDHIRL
jgi:hypothetical protein